MLGGGIIEGDSVLVSGPSGTGKSALATQFLAEGLRHGDAGIALIGSMGEEGAVMMVAFGGVLAANLSRGRRPSCNCFGQVANHPISWWSKLLGFQVLSSTEAEYGALTYCVKETEFVQELMEDLQQGDHEDKKLVKIFVDNQSAIATEARMRPDFRAR